MLESITNFFSLSLLELSVYDLVILVLFTVSLILTLVFGLIVIATKVRKLNNDIDNQISKQLSNDKAIINYLDVIMNQLSNSKVDLKSNLEIRDNVSKQETPESTPYTNLTTVSSSNLPVEYLPEKEKLSTGTDLPKTGISEETTVSKDSADKVSQLTSSETSSLKDSINTSTEVSLHKEENNDSNNRITRRNSLLTLENEIKNIPLERKKIINSVVENINTLSALEEVSQKIEEKIKQVENTEEKASLENSKALQVDNYQVKENLSTNNMLNLNNVASINNDYYSESIPIIQEDQNENEDYQYNHLNSETINRNRPTLTRNPVSRRERPEERDLSSRLRTSNSSTINNPFSRLDPQSRPSLGRPARIGGDFAVDKVTNFNDNVNSRISSRFNEIDDSSRNASERVNFRPLSLNLLNRNNEGISNNRVSSSGFGVATSNNEEGQGNMYNNTMNRSRMNRASSSTNSMNNMGGMNRNPSMSMSSSMGGGMSRPAGGMNRSPMGGMGSSSMGSGMSRPAGGMNRSPMGGMGSSMGGGMSRPAGGMNRSPMGMGSSMGGMKPANATVGSRPQLSSGRRR